YRVVTHYALAYPHIRFSLQVDNRLTFQTSGNGELFDALAAVFGLDTARQMLPVEGEEEFAVSAAPAESTRLAVYGYTGAPALHRGGRDQIVFFVNKRWIQDRALNQAVVQAYHTFLPVNRYPIAVLNIELDPVEVDVNVHPTKAEVKFREPRAIFKLVQKRVRQAVLATAPVPGYGAPSADVTLGGHAGDPVPWQSSFDRPHAASFSRFGFEMQRTSPFLPEPAGDEADQPPDRAGLTPAIPPLRVIGQIQQMYIVTEGPDGLYLIDQHAAHERILYDKLAATKAQAAAVSQQLLEPLVVELSPGQAALLEAELAALTEIGFQIEPFGGAAFRLRAVPEMLGQADPAQALIDILAEIADGAVPLARATHDKIAIIVCKRASIKGGQVLSHEEMRELIRQLEATSAPRTCPHGRPTMIHLSAAQLAREFGRL
ncbi:MAG: DNA mismatch repair protein MutL, partial [Chloroflexota bacterium]